MSRPAFLITVDTEGDNLWSRPRTLTTRNTEYLPRFQSLCEIHGFKPTYLTNWEMATSPAFQEFGRDLLARGTGEIGMHLHAWDSPPLQPLTADDTANHPYLIEFPDDQMRAKIDLMTRTLEDTFGVKMTSHRAGRWAFDERYARILIDQGYLVDCSVTPHISWRRHLGDPSQNGGSDYTGYPEEAYFVDPADISRPGISPLLEIPLTVIPYHYPAAVQGVRSWLTKSHFGSRVANRLLPELTQFTGSSRDRNKLLRTLAVARAERRPFIEFAIHSSEVIPGGSPSFPTADSIEALYETLEVVFAAAAGTFGGATLTEYYHDVLSSRGKGPGASQCAG